MANRYLRFFWIACAIEAALLPMAAALAYLAGQPLMSNFTGA